MRNWIRYADERIGNLIIFNWVHSLAKVAATMDRRRAGREAQEGAEQGAAGGVDTRRPQALHRRGARRRRAASWSRCSTRWKTRCGRPRWLAGDAYSIADIAVVPFIKRIDEEIAPDEMTPARHPRVAEWWASIQARPAFATARIEGFQDELAKV